jgi:hypothetical protein
MIYKGKRWTLAPNLVRIEDGYLCHCNHGRTEVANNQLTLTGYVQSHSMEVLGSNEPS